MLRLAPRPLLLSAVLTMCCAGPALTQKRDPADSAGPIMTRLGLRIGAVVRVASAGGMRVEGSVLRSTNGALLLRIAGREQLMLLDAADSVWVLGSAAKRGAITGGVVGAALTAAAVAAFHASCASGTDDPCTGGKGLVQLGIGAAGGGALVGAVVGSRFPLWHRRLP